MAEKIENNLKGSIRTFMEKNVNPVEELLDGMTEYPQSEQKNTSKSSKKAVKLFSKLLKIIKYIESKGDHSIDLSGTKDFQNNLMDVKTRKLICLIKTFFDENLQSSANNSIKLEKSHILCSNGNFRTTAMFEMCEKYKLNNENEKILDEIDKYVKHFLINISTIKIHRRQSERLLQEILTQVEYAIFLRLEQICQKDEDNSEVPSSLSITITEKYGRMNLNNNYGTINPSNINHSREVVKKPFLKKIKNFTTFLYCNNHDNLLKVKSLSTIISTEDECYNRRKQDIFLKIKNKKDQDTKTFLIKDQNYHMSVFDSVGYKKSPDGTHNISEFHVHGEDVEGERTILSSSSNSHSSLEHNKNMKSRKSINEEYGNNLRFQRITNAAIQSAKLTNMRHIIKMNFLLCKNEISVSVQDLEEKNNYDQRFFIENNGQTTIAVFIHPSTNLKRKDSYDHEMFVKRDKVIKQLIAIPKRFHSYFYDCKYKKDTRVIHIEQFCYCLISIKANNPREAMGVISKEDMPVNIVYDMEKGNDVGCINMIKKLLNLFSKQIRIIREFKLTIEGSFEEIFYR